MLQTLLNATRPSPQIWRSARVLEVGIGDGWLGVWLLKTASAAHYIGIDVSLDSLGEARARLVSNGLVEGPHARGFELAFASSKAFSALASSRVDVVVSQKTMQHFPSADYTRRWLRQVGRLGAQSILLQFCRPCNEEDAQTRAAASESSGANGRGLECAKGWSGGHKFSGARCQMSSSTAARLLEHYRLARRHAEALPGIQHCNIWARFEVRT